MQLRELLDTELKADLSCRARMLVVKHAERLLPPPSSSEVSIPVKL